MNFIIPSIGCGYRDPLIILKPNIGFKRGGCPTPASHAAAPVMPVQPKRAYPLAATATFSPRTVDFHAALCSRFRSWARLPGRITRHAVIEDRNMRKIRLFFKGAP
jgi:hypothetical protein